MCGIVGIFRPRDVPSVDIDIGALLSVMRHRGPDGEGQYSNNDRRYQSGFNRLAIIDLETGDQPIIDSQNNRVLTGNGEIYNFKELRRQPELSAYRFITNGDMEVILPLATIYGDDFVDHLNGMFALALYDEGSHRLLLTRDRLGVKPLYWAALPGGGLIYASEIKALFHSGLIDRAIDSEAVNSYLAHGYVPGSETIFRDVKKLRPGHQLEINANGKITISRYWRPTADENFPTDAEDAKARLIDLLSESVGLNLRSDVSVGALLSGGLDSGLIVALAAMQSDQPINTYTISFDGADVDEAPLAEAIAKQYGTRHETISLSADGVVDSLCQMVWHCEEPLNDAALFPNMLVEGVLGERMKVALNGTGGDEIFAGYQRYFLNEAEKKYLRIPSALRDQLAGPLTAAISPMLAWKLNRAEAFANDRGDYLHDHSTQFPPPMRQLIGNRQIFHNKAQQAPFAAFEGPADTAQLAADLETYLPDNLLLLLDKTSMAASVEGRVPLLDHRLVEAALALPPDVRAPHGKPKSLMRDIAADFLPEAVVQAPKQGFASPVQVWMQSGLGEISERILTSPRSLARGWWTEPGIRRLATRPHKYGFRLYALLMLELTIRIHAENSFSEAPEGPLEDILRVA